MTKPTQESFNAKLAALREKSRRERSEAAARREAKARELLTPEPCAPPPMLKARKRPIEPIPTLCAAKSAVRSLCDESSQSEPNRIDQRQSGLHHMTRLTLIAQNRPNTANVRDGSIFEEPRRRQLFSRAQVRPRPHLQQRLYPVNMDGPKHRPQLTEALVSKLDSVAVSDRLRRERQVNRCEKWRRDVPEQMKESSGSEFSFGTNTYATERSATIVERQEPCKPSLALPKRRVKKLRITRQFPISPPKAVAAAPKPAPEPTPKPIKVIPPASPEPVQAELSAVEEEEKAESIAGSDEVTSTLQILRETTKSILFDGLATVMGIVKTVESGVKSVVESITQTINKAREAQLEESNAEPQASRPKSVQPSNLVAKPQGGATEKPAAASRDKAAEDTSRVVRSLDVRRRSPASHPVQYQPAHEGEAETVKSRRAQFFDELDKVLDGYRSASSRAIPKDDRLTHPPEKSSKPPVKSTISGHGKRLANPAKRLRQLLEEDARRNDPDTNPAEQSAKEVSKSHQSAMP